MGLLQKNTSQFSLEHLVAEPATGISNPPLIILLHGMGSNEQDLFALKDYFPSEYLVVTARAPIVTGINQFSWFDYNLVAGERQVNSSQVETARLKIISFIEELKTEHQFDASQVYLVGFSQGAMLAYATALSMPGLVKGIVAMSGRILEEVKPQIAAAEALKDLAIFISHGTADPVVPVSYARAAKQYLEDLGLQPSYQEYAAEHYLNEEIIESISQWLKR